MALVIWGIEAHADHSYPMPADGLFKITAYDPDSRTFTLVSQGEGCQEAHAATGEELAHGVRAVNLQLVGRYPQSIVGRSYKADREFMLLAQSQIEARRRRAKRKGNGS